MGRKKKFNIPFPTQSKEAKQVYYYISKKGLSLQDAIDKVNKKTGKSTSVVKDTSPFPQPSVLVGKLKDKPRPGIPGSGYKVTAKDLLNHPGVPEKVKDQLLVTMEEGTKETQDRNIISTHLRTSARSDTVVPPTPPAQSDVLNPHMVRWLQRLCTDLEKINDSLLALNATIRQVGGRQ